MFICLITALVSLTIHMLCVDSIKQKIYNENSALSSKHTNEMEAILKEAAKSDDVYVLHPSLIGGKERLKNMIARKKGDIAYGEIRIFNEVGKGYSGLAGYGTLYVEESKGE